MLNKYETNMKKIEIMSQNGNVSSEFTPAELCQEILDKIDVVNKTILTFNVEFVLTLIYKYDVDRSNITICTDDVNVRGICERGRINCIDTMEPNMKFDVVVGNPPFSLAGNKTGKKGGAKKLYPAFYEKAVVIADNVAMITPNTQRQHISFNKFIRANTNKIIPIDDSAFSVNISTWCLIKDNSNTNVDHIEWADLYEMPDQKVRWAKGKVHVTHDSNLLEDRKGPYTVFHKVNLKGLHQSKTDIEFSKLKLFPENGYAVIMPQQIQDRGWSATEIVKCDGAQAATNGVNLAFVDTRDEAEHLVEYMKGKRFVEQALSHCGGFRNMTLTALKKINMDDYVITDIAG
jgi:desulfoferrodoxin (superoxide reductase-like protein)